MRWGMEEMRNPYSILIGKLEGKRGVDWMHLAQDRDNWKPL